MGATDVPHCAASQFKGAPVAFVGLEGIYDLLFAETAKQVRVRGVCENESKNMKTIAQVRKEIIEKGYDTYFKNGRMKRLLNAAQKKLFENDLKKWFKPIVRKKK